MPGSFPDLKMRRYKPDDLPTLLALWDTAVRSAMPHLDATYIASERRALTDTYLPATTTWVAEQDAPVGFISVLNDSEIAGLFVSPDAQRVGIGRALLDHVARNTPQLTLEVLERNLTARAFYASYGFAHVSDRIDPDSGETLLRLRLG